MNPKHHTSLKIAKQLAEAGIVIESEYWWQYTDVPLPDGTRWVVKHKSRLSEVDFELSSPSDIIPAPIATEILEWFPKGYDFGFELIKLGEGYGAICKDYRVMPYKRIGFEKDDNASDALALLLIRLTKDGLI